jgi:hypothetical protein
MMELNANVKYGNGSACYIIRKENPGIYYAHLVYFDGHQKSAPPQNITLIRGIRQWKGSLDDRELLNELGKIIEEAYHQKLSSKTNFK